ncbi:MAG TPA: hypothetical protein VL173_09485 [Vicinamibacterales bacterium]|nr:hypothetical protein [Vicinamibacterales bacterium]
MANLNAEQLRRLARLGAMARLEQIRDEEAGIRAEFPELFAGSRGGRRQARGGRKANADGAAGAGGKRRRRRRPPMSAAARKAVGERMRKYWAERRRAKGAK